MLIVDCQSHYLHIKIRSEGHEKTNYAAAIAAAALFTQSTLALAINVVNCIGHKIKILIFNQNDKVQAINKRVIVLKNTDSIKGFDIRGTNFHQF